MQDSLNKTLTIQQQQQQQKNQQSIDIINERISSAATTSCDNGKQLPVTPITPLATPTISPISPSTPFTAKSMSNKLKITPQDDDDVETEILDSTHQQQQQHHHSHHQQRQPQSQRAKVSTSIQNLDAESNQKQQQQQQQQLNKPNSKYMKSERYKRIKHATDQSMLFNLIEKLIILVINSVVLALIAIIFIIVLPFKILKYVIFKLFHLVNIRNYDYLGFLTPMELFWLYDNKYNKSIGSCLFIIEGNLSRNTIRDLIKNRVINASSRSGHKLFPRFTQTIAKIWGFGYAWLDTGDSFNVEDHIEEISTNLKTNDDLQQYLVKLTTSDLDFQKPLWQIYYKQNFGPERNTILVFVYHLCLSDGISLFRLLFKGLVDNRLAIDIKPRFAHKNHSLKLLKLCLFGWQRIFYDLFIKRKDMNLIHMPNLSGKKVITWSEPFNLVSANRLKLVTRSTMNDLILSVLSGIMRSFLKSNGVNNPGNMHCIMPVNLRSNKYPLELGHKATITSFKVPSNTEGCIPRLWSTKDIIAKHKKSAEYLQLYVLINFLFQILPNSFASTIVNSIVNLSTFMASSVAAGNSSLSTVSVGNRSVKNIIYIQPAIANLAISCSVITYGDELRLAIVSDSAIVPNPDLIAKEFVAQMEILRELLANRRIPGEIRKAIREPIIRASVSNMLDSSDDLTIEEIQIKMTEIQLELQALTHQYETIDKTSGDFIQEKKRIAMRLDSLRKEFHTLLMRIQVRQVQESQAIPSDDEDELDPEVRVRLRSASIASRTSLTSNHRVTRHKSLQEPNSLDEKSGSSRKPSFTRHASHSYGAGLSNLSDRILVNNRAHSDHLQSDNLHVV